MRSKLFHTIVICGVALGGSLGCSSDDEAEGEDKGTGGHHNCAPDVATGGTGGADAEAGAPGSETAGTGAAAGSSAVGCGGWPPTK